MKHLTIAIFFFIFPFLAIAETYQYELKGSFVLDSSKQSPVKYTLKWSEDNGRIRGVYTDDFFAKKVPVSGEGSDIGRTFIIKFPESKSGVKSITVLSSTIKGTETGTSVPVSVITRDNIGNPLTTAKAKSEFVITSYGPIAQLQEEYVCTDGFGVLGGYCGVYAGLLAEEQDRRNRCNLLLSDAVRLELSTDGMMILHLGEVNNIITTPAHTIGRIPSNPQKQSVDIMSRDCGPLSGVNSSSSSCKILHLKGQFSTIKGVRHFQGTYNIAEEGTNNTCRYSLSMDREED